MSSILKALRKLEDEKANMGEGSVDLAHDILRRSYENKPSSSAWKVVALLAAVLLLGAGFWMFSPTDDSSQTSINKAQGILPLTVPAQLEEKPSSKSVVVLPEHYPATDKKSSPVAQKNRPATVKKSLAISAKATSSSPVEIPELLIEEIVYAEDPSARLAVVNDLPVMQGTDIAGARVIKIYPDRVRFEVRGIQFDKYKR